MAPRPQSPTPTVLLQARIPADLRATIQRIARQDGQSLNTITITLLRAGVASLGK